MAPSLGPLDRYTVGTRPAVRPTWVKDKLVELTIIATAKASPGIEHVSRTHKLIAQLAKVPAAAELRVLHIGKYDSIADVAVKPAAAVARVLAKLPALRELTFGDPATVDTVLGDITPLWTAASKLEKLSISGRSFVVTEVPPLALRELRIVTTAMKDAALRAIAAAPMPALARLELDLGGGSWGDCCMPPDIIAMLARPALRQLTLRTAFGAELAAWLSKAPLLRQLDQLTLDWVSAKGIRAMAKARAAFAHLSRLEVGTEAKAKALAEGLHKHVVVTVP